MVCPDQMYSPEDKRNSFKYVSRERCSVMLALKGELVSLWSTDGSLAAQRLQSALNVEAQYGAGGSLLVKKLSGKFHNMPSDGKLVSLRLMPRVNAQSINMPKLNEYGELLPADAQPINLDDSEVEQQHQHSSWLHSNQGGNSAHSAPIEAQEPKTERGG